MSVRSCKKKSQNRNDSSILCRHGCSFPEVSVRTVVCVFHFLEVLLESPRTYHESLKDSCHIRMVLGW